MLTSDLVIRYESMLRNPKDINYIICNGLYDLIKCEKGNIKFTETIYVSIDIGGTDIGIYESMADTLYYSEIKSDFILDSIYVNGKRTLYYKINDRIYDHCSCEFNISFDLIIKILKTIEEGKFL